MKVSVLLVTYNHERFIVQAIESVLMQVTDFEYEMVIIEDCSTDSTRDIVIDYQKRHPGKIRLMLAEENKCDNRAFAAALQASPSQYIAFLDGDDYWTSPHKLQKQVDFLDSHPECAMCFHNVTVFHEDGSQEPFNRNPANQKEISTLEDLWLYNFIAGCSPMLRKGLVDELPEWYYTAMWGDWPLYILYAQHGTIGYIDEVMGAYRVHSGGIWSRLSLTQQLEAIIEFYESINADLNFKYSKTIESMISRYSVQLAMEQSGLPSPCTVIVAGRSDDTVAYWGKRRAWNFPETEDGAFVGHPPASNEEAIAHLDAMRIKGGDYLLFPKTAFWWLDRFQDFCRHLDTRHRRIWSDEHCIIYQLLKMAPVDVVEVSLPSLVTEQLWGRYVGSPKPGSQVEASAVKIAGWVVGRSAPAVTVEVLHNDTIIRRVPIGERRPKPAAAFPHVPGAERSGFSTIVNVLGAAEALELRLQAVLQDQSRVPFSILRLQPRWPEVAEAANKPLISVIICCYNEAHVLDETIESVLAQTYPHLELLVVDDRSTDNPAAVVARYPGVRLIQQANQGLAAARNRGLQESKGEYLVFLDSSDRLLPHALDNGLESLKANPECAFVFGRGAFIPSDSSPLHTPQFARVKGDHYAALLRHNYIPMSALVMYRRAIFDSMTGFDSSVNGSADYELYLRITRDFQVYCHDKVVAEYRQKDPRNSSSIALISTLGIVERQWNYVKSNQYYREAYKAGLKLQRERLGKALVEEARTDLKNRDWWQALHRLWLLMRHCSPLLVGPVSRSGVPTL